MIFASSTDDFDQADPVSTTFAADEVDHTQAEVSHEDPQHTRLQIVPELRHDQVDPTRTSTAP